MRKLAIILALLLSVVVASATSPHRGEAAPLFAEDALIASTGKITFLRVHDVGTGYGPATDFIDVEVVVKLDSTGPSKSFGFQVRDDAQRAARQGMLDLLRDAFNNNWTVTLDYDIASGKNNGTIIRVALSK
ncbi:MAG: hypothetical protein H3C34_19285 [Caldilineaceae bacterium]|nr:hypothetical protein [Caldilineaceae bacterium]